MWSDTSSPSGGALETRFSTPAPELDDHRPRLGRSSPMGVPSPVTRSPNPRSPIIAPGTKLDIPALEVQAATPFGSTSGDADLLKVDDALRAAQRLPVARDFEQAIDDASSDGAEGLTGVGGRGLGRRDTRRGGRPRDIARHDRSRDTSSSRSTSPANSVEAFAEPRRRQRANTLDSHASVAEFRGNRNLSFDAATRRPTLSNISVPAALTRCTNETIPDDITVDFEDEPGKTYKIDFEELDEFVALCAQGLIPGQSEIDSVTSSQQTEPKVFTDLRPTSKLEQFNNVALNPDTFFEKPLELQSTATPQSTNEGGREGVATTSKGRNGNRERFTFFSSEIQHSKNAAKLGDLVSGEDSFRDLFEIGPEGGVWWLDVVNPTKAELEVIAKAFKIHRLTREDIETQEDREKVELFSQYYFVSFRSFNPDKESEDFLDPLHVYIVVTAGGVLSFSYAPNPHAKNVRRRIAKLGDFLSLGPDYICYALIDDIVDCFAPIIQEAEVESEAIEDQVFIAREDDLTSLLRQIGECRKRVLNMMRLLGGKADVIRGFAKRCNEQYQMTPRGDIGLYLGDIQDHVVTMMSNLGHVEKMLSRSHANYLAHLNVDNILKGNHTNKALAKITVLASIIVPLNIITGLFGMNVHVPGMGEGTFAWFGGIVGFMFAFIVFSLLVAKRLKYI